MELKDRRAVDLILMLGLSERIYQFANDKPCGLLWSSAEGKFSGFWEAISVQG